MVMKSTHFDFENKVFAVKGAHFGLTNDTQRPVYYVTLGDLKAAIELPTLRTEFRIERDSHDWELLDIVEQSLRFVREIRPGDSIPTEILDGSASWTVEERHRVLARARIMVQLAAWMTGSDGSINDTDQLAKLADQPETKQRVQEAFGEIAVALGLGKEKQHEIVDMIDELAQELSYIEALRDHFNNIRNIGGKIKQLSRLYLRERSVGADLQRVEALFRTPLNKFTATFDEIEAQTGETLAVLKQFRTQIKYIRDTRDMLHWEFMRWDELMDKWKKQPVEQSERVEKLIKETYQFLARHYPLVKQWNLSG